jgi:hypothetical protein
LRELQIIAFNFRLDILRAILRISPLWARAGLQYFLVKIAFEIEAKIRFLYWGLILLTKKRFFPLKHRKFTRRHDPTGFNLPWA